jgi:hypothetical protein
VPPSLLLPIPYIEECPEGIHRLVDSIPTANRRDELLQFRNLLRRHLTSSDLARGQAPPTGAARSIPTPKEKTDVKPSYDVDIRLRIL